MVMPIDGFSGLTGFLKCERKEFCLTEE